MFCSHFLCFFTTSAIFFLFLVNYFSSYLFFLHLTLPHLFDTYSNFKSHINIFFFCLQCLIVGIFFFFRKWRTSKLLSRELQMISEEELSVTSKIGLEGFFQESGKSFYAYYTYTVGNALYRHKALHYYFFNSMLFSFIIGY